MKFLRKRSGTLQLLNGNRKNIIVIESIPAHVQKGFYLIELLKIQYLVGNY